MNQTEIDELRRLASVSREPRHGIGCIASDCALASAARNALPRLLAALEEARAERDRMRDVLLRNNFAPCDTQACNCGGWHERATGDGFYARFREIEEAIGDHNGKTVLAAVVEMVQERDSLEEARDERDKWEGRAKDRAKTNLKLAHDIKNTEYLAWDALGRPDGTHDTSNVQRLCEAHGALKAKLAHAEAEAAGYQKLAQACKDEDGKTVVVIIQGESEVRVFGPNSDCEERFGEVVVRWWKLLDTVGESKAFDALKAERDAIKATLAKRAESERAWCELATARGAKLAALVAEVDDIVTNGIDDAEGAGGYSSEFALGCLCRALAAAKVQP